MKFKVGDIVYYKCSPACLKIVVYAGFRNEIPSDHVCLKEFSRQFATGHEKVYVYYRLRNKEYYNDHRCYGWDRITCKVETKMEKL